MKPSNVLIHSVKEAGKIIMKHYQNKTNKEENFIYAKGALDIFTIADIEAEKKIKEIIRKEFPNHSILAEESEFENMHSDFLWIIDPIDGTKNYANGLPIFCTAVALAYKGRVEMGAVYNPVSDEFFFAERGKGAFLNDKRIKVNSKKMLQESLIASGYVKEKGKKLLDYKFMLMKKIMPKALGFRHLGAFQLVLTDVACGRFAGAFINTCHPWDFAAGMIIVQEAGGIVTDFNGKEILIKSPEPSTIIAGNPIIHKELKKLIDSVKD